MQNNPMHKFRVGKVAALFFCSTEFIRGQYTIIHSAVATIVLLTPDFFSIRCC